MIIKRWNTATTSFVEEYPKTTTAHIFSSTGAQIFTGDKLGVGYLPDAVFDSLYFFNTASGTSLSDHAFDAIRNAAPTSQGGIGRDEIGYYWVVSSSNTFLGNTTSEIYPTVAQIKTAEDAGRTFASFSAFNEQAPYYYTGSPNGVVTAANGTYIHSSDTNIYVNQGGGTTWVVVTGGGALPFASLSNSGTYYDTRTRKLYQYSGTNNSLGQLTAATVTGFYIQTKFAPTEGSGSVTSTSATLEAGDWFIITKIEGTGASGTPYIVTFAVVNNTYEDATSTAKGIVQLSAVDNLAPYNVSTNPTGISSISEVITEANLSSLVVANTASKIAPSIHSHGDLNSSGIISTNTSVVSGQHLIVTTHDTNAIKQSAVTFGSTTTTFLSNAGTWLTPAGTYSHPNHSGDVTSVGDGATTIANKAVTLAKMDDLVANSIIGNNTGSAATPIALTATQVRTFLNVADGANAYSHPNHSGDVTSVGDGATTIAANVVSNSKLAQVATNIIKGRVSANTGNVEDLSAANVRSIIEVVPIFVQATTAPTTTVANALWYDIA
jgi:hypothetical protein